MDIRDQQINDITVVTIEGSIDAFTAVQLSEHIHELISRDEINLVADFNGVDYTSSAGLRVLFEAYKDARSKGGDLTLVGLQPGVERVLTISGFIRIFQIFPDVPSAINSFS
jgi:anti-sigma B factor antagonist